MLEWEDTKRISSGNLEGHSGSNLVPDLFTYQCLENLENNVLTPLPVAALA